MHVDVPVPVAIDVGVQLTVRPVMGLVVCDRFTMFVNPNLPVTVTVYAPVEVPAVKFAVMLLIVKGETALLT